MSTTSAYAGPGAPTSSEDRQFFGQPRGLATLFFTEMWERFSYYGMRALLILFMTAATTGNNPGLGLDVGTAAAIYGLYTALVYLLALPGGWVADNLWGQRKAVYVGGWIIAAGHFSMAVPTEFTFYAGLVLIVMGTGLLKAQRQHGGGRPVPRRGSPAGRGVLRLLHGDQPGSSIRTPRLFVPGRGLQLALGLLPGGVRHGPRPGPVQDGHQVPGRRRDPENGELAALSRKFFTLFFGTLGAIVLFGWLVAQGTIPLSLTQIATGLGSGILILIGIYFVYLLGFGGHDGEEKRRLTVILWLFVLAALFWSGFEQAGSSLNLFAQDLTDRDVFGWLMPAGFLQSVNAGMIIVFSPIFAFVWVWLAKRNANPSIPVKFSLGLLGLAAGFFVISWGAANATADNLASPSWLVVMYFLHTMGELSLSPVGLSSITKLAPKGRVGQMMGVWFVATALGNLIAGLVAGSLETLPPFALFRTVAIIIGGAGLVALLVSPGVKKVMGHVE